jgi:hypothetical protein
METLLNPQEIGKGIADFGFVIMAAACYLIFSTTIIFFFARWFVRIIDGIIERQQRTLDEILALQKEQINLLEDINREIKLIA